MKLPMSGRTAEMEMLYQKEKARGGLNPLHEEPSVKEFKYWRVVSNRFPYNAFFKSHHLLLPKRSGVADRWDLNEEEKTDLEFILREYVYDEYDLWFENCPKRRSVAAVYHLHLATYKDER